MRDLHSYRLLLLSRDKRKISGGNRRHLRGVKINLRHRESGQADAENEFDRVDAKRETRGGELGIYGVCEGGEFEAASTG